MQWSLGGRAGAARGVCRGLRVADRPPSARWRSPPARSTASPTASAGQPRGATVAFESIDGPPPGQFQRAGAGAQRRGADAPAGGDVARKPVGLSRARLSRRQGGASGRPRSPGCGTCSTATSAAPCASPARRPPRAGQRDAWAAADDAMLRRIARSSMDQLAAFLTSPEVAPGTPDARAAHGARRRHAIPRPKRPAFSASSRPTPIRRRRWPRQPAATGAAPCRCRRRRPPDGRVVSAREALTLAAVEPLIQRPVHLVQKLRDNDLDSYCGPLPALL